MKISVWDFGITVLVLLLPFSYLNYLGQRIEADFRSPSVRSPEPGCSVTSAATPLIETTATEPTTEPTTVPVTAPSEEALLEQRLTMAREALAGMAAAPDTPPVVAMIVTVDEESMHLPLFHDINQLGTSALVFLISTRKHVTTDGRFSQTSRMCLQESLEHYTSPPVRQPGDPATCYLMIRDFIPRGISALQAVLDAVDLLLAVDPHWNLLVHRSIDHSCPLPPDEYYDRLQGILAHGFNIAAPPGKLDYMTPEAERFDGSSIYLETRAEVPQPVQLRSLTDDPMQRYFGLASVTGASRSFGHVGHPWFVLQRPFCEWMQDSDAARNMLFLYASTLNPLSSFVPTLLMETYWNITVPGQTANTANGMVSLYPLNESTDPALYRLIKIFQPFRCTRDKPCHSDHIHHFVTTENSVNQDYIFVMT